MISLSSKKKLLTQACVLAAPLLLVGCSSVPDAVNPVEWYRSSVDYFSEDETETQQASETQSENSDSAAMETAEAAPAPEKEIADGFVSAGNPNRQYAEPVMRENDVVSPLGEATIVAEKEPSAPLPAPSTSVSVSEPEGGDQSSQTVNVHQPNTQETLGRATTRRLTGTPSPRDNRSVGQVYADNLAQNRPLNIQRNTMQNPADMSFGGMNFDTVVVSSGGVTRQSATYPTQRSFQTASLETVQSDFSSTYVAGMAIEPQVVREGRAQSLQSLNQGIFNGSFQVATIQFNNGSSNLTSEDQRILQEVVNIHRQQGGVVRIVGHASSRTRDMSPQEHVKVNLTMSMHRADTVARQLLQLGVSGDRLFVGGVSDSQPIYQEVMPSGEAGNRRTEIFIDY